MPASLPSIGRWCVYAAVLAALLPTSVAFAANGNMPRTPALYPPHECLSIVDRSVDPTLRFAVHIPFEDTMISADELSDSRQFSFFGLCRDTGRLELLPNWIANDDADRALEAGIIDTLPAADDVLLASDAWRTGHDGADSCVQSVLAERIPISCAATQDGVLWDTTAVPAGNYVIRGYTFAPAFNLWTSRTGVVQVRDGAPLPVAALVSPVYDAKAFQEAGYRVLGCMDGPAGTMVSLQWASTASDNLGDDAAWTEFASLDASERVIDLQMMLAVDTVYLGLLLRAVATGPDGASWIGHAPGFVTVYPGDGESDDPEVPPPPDHCEAGGDTSGGFGASTSGEDTSGEGSSSSTTDGTDGGAAEDGGGGGCGCIAADRDRSTWMIGLVLACTRRRRGRDHDCGTAGSARAR